MPEPLQQIDDMRSGVGVQFLDAIDPPLTGWIVAVDELYADHDCTSSFAGRHRRTGRAGSPRRHVRNSCDAPKASKTT
jgi:hypothetical protein